MNRIAEFIYAHHTAIGMLAVDLAHRFYKFWQTVQGLQGLSIFFLTGKVGSKPASTDAQPKI